jgi:hypothetical protein
MYLCQMDSTIIQTHRYFDSEWFQCRLHRFGSSTTLKPPKTKNQTHLLSPISKKCQLWPPQRVPSTHFFSTKLYIHHIGVWWVDLDTYIGHMTHLNNGHFSTRPPSLCRIARMDLIGNSVVTFRDYDTIVHKRKLVPEQTQGGFLTNHPPRWLG